jgi:hypothetical protein
MDSRGPTIAECNGDHHIVHFPQADRPQTCETAAHLWRNPVVSLPHPACAPTISFFALKALFFAVMERGLLSAAPDPSNDPPR